MEPFVTLLHRHAIDTSELTRLPVSTAAPLYHLPISFTQRAPLWVTFCDLAEESGYWPVLVDDLYGVTRAVERSVQQHPRTILDEAATLDPRVFMLAGTSYTRLPQPAEVITDFLTALEQEYDYRDGDFVSYHALRAEAETALTNAALWVRPVAFTRIEHLGLETTPDTEGTPANIILVPTTRCWEIAALVPEYPASSTADASTSVRLLQDWHTRYCAELVEIGRSTLTLRATRPPQTPEQALILAWEHTQYCPDISTLDIVRRAVELTQGKAWSFWWD